MGKPRVTWLLPVRNAEQTLESTLISIAEQDYPGRAQTVYVWDDGSTDATPALLRKWIGRELQGRVLGNARIGTARALAQLVAGAQTELLARIDAGHVAETDRLIRQVDYLCDHRKVGVVGTQMSGLDGRQTLTDHPCDDAELRWSLRFTNPVSHPTLMLRRSAVLEAGNYRQVQDGPEDYDLWVRMALIVRFATLSQSLLRYREPQRQTQGTDTAVSTDPCERFYRTRDALIDRLLPGTDPIAGRRLLNLVRHPDDLHVSADDLLRFRHAAMLAAKACRYPPTFYTATRLFQQQYDNLKTRRLKGQPLIRPVWPLLKRAGRLIHKDANKPSDTAAA